MLGHALRDSALDRGVRTNSLDDRVFTLAGAHLRLLEAKEQSGLEIPAFLTELSPCSSGTGWLKPKILAGSRH